MCSVGIVYADTIGRLYVEVRSKLRQAKIGVRYLLGFQKKEGPRRSKSIIQARASALGFRELKCDPSNLEGRGDQTEYHTTTNLD